MDAGKGSASYVLTSAVPSLTGGACAKLSAGAKYVSFYGGLWDVAAC